MSENVESPREVLARRITEVSTAEANIAEAERALDNARERLYMTTAEISQLRKSGGIPGDKSRLVSALAEGEISDAFNETQGDYVRKIEMLEEGEARWRFMIEGVEGELVKRRADLESARRRRDNAAKDVLAEVVPVDALEAEVSALRESLASNLRTVHYLKGVVEHGSPVMRRLEKLFHGEIALGNVERSVEVAPFVKLAEALKQNAGAKLEV